MSKKTITLLLIPICALLIYIAKNPKKPNTISSPIPVSSFSPTPAIPTESSLSFIPDTIYALTGKNNKVSIQLNSQGKYPTGAQLELAYDPTILTGITLDPGTLFADPDILLNNINERIGRISYALSLSPNKNPSAFSGTVAALNFTIKEYMSQKETTIYFLPKTSILSQNINIPLKIAYGLKILVNTPPSIIASPSSSLK